MARVLVIEDDPNVAFVVEEALASNNYVVEAVSNGKEGLERLLYGGPYDLVIVDWMLPEVTGLEICQKFRQGGGASPVLFLTGRNDINNKVSALESGADDYLCKPFSLAELLARVRALLRRPTALKSRVLESAGLTFDLDSCVVVKDGSEVGLSPSEYALLELFMSNPGKVFSSDELIDRVFKTDADASDDAVRQRVLRLRKKIDRKGVPSAIVTVKGLGYRFEPQG